MKKGAKSLNKTNKNVMTQNKAPTRMDQNAKLTEALVFFNVQSMSLFYRNVNRSEYPSFKWLNVSSKCYHRYTYICTLIILALPIFTYY